jgi:hypothetical protein
MWSPGFDSQAGGGEAAVDQVGAVLDLLELAFDDALRSRPPAMTGATAAPTPR